MSRSRRDGRRWRAKERKRTKEIDPAKVKLGRERRAQRDAERKQGR